MREWLKKLSPENQNQRQYTKYNTKYKMFPITTARIADATEKITAPRASPDPLFNAKNQNELTTT